MSNILADYRFIITCEHASSAIPGPWTSLLEPYCESCETHQVWDPGATEIASRLGKLLQAPVFKGEYTRLLVDLNRSVNKPGLFSPLIEELPPQVRTRILTTYYYPFRHQVIRALDYLVTEKRPVIHISVHTFTPVLKGVERTADFGLLFDSALDAEAKLGAAWLQHLRGAEPGLVCKANYPYLGSSDGHTTAMRRSFGRCGYLGMELEFNQKLPLSENADLYARWIHRALERSLDARRIPVVRRQIR